ncbi:MAG: hypothetical protein NVS3B10_26020 [Polyangiales bacterium]
MKRHSKSSQPSRPSRSDGGDAFLPDPGSGPARTRDSLAENLAEGFLSGAPSRDAAFSEAIDEPTAEDDGGPFITTRGRTEFGHGRDASNPRGSMREPFPNSGGGGEPEE